MARGNGGNGKGGTEVKGSALYEVLKGIDFEKRELLPAQNRIVKSTGVEPFAHHLDGFAHVDNGRYLDGLGQGGALDDDSGP